MHTATNWMVTILLLYHPDTGCEKGALNQEWFGCGMVRLCCEVRRVLEDGSMCSSARTALTYFELFKVEEGLWGFAQVPGDEPTNNGAERLLRFVVIGRGNSREMDRERARPVRGAAPEHRHGRPPGYLEISAA